MKFRVQDGLPFVAISLVHNNNELALKNVLLDTGSAGCVFATDAVARIGLHPEPQDTIRQIHGIGGVEFVFTKQVGAIKVGALQADDFMIEIGAMAYGFNFDGILGFDFLQQTGAIIDLTRLEMYSTI